jgi:hypothetical protein
MQASSRALRHAGDGRPTRAWDATAPFSIMQAFPLPLRRRLLGTRCERPPACDRSPSRYCIRSKQERTPFSAGREQQIDGFAGLRRRSSQRRDLSLRDRCRGAPRSKAKSCPPGPRPVATHHPMTPQYAGRATTARPHRASMSGSSTYVDPLRRKRTMTPSARRRQNKPATKRRRSDRTVKATARQRSHQRFDAGTTGVARTPAFHARRGPGDPGPACICTARLWSGPRASHKLAAERP